MKKTLSLVLALALAVSMVAAFALVPSASTLSDPLQMTGIMVTNAAGYAAPYVAVDESNPFVENQTAYVVVSFRVAKRGDDDYAQFDGSKAFRLDITSSTLDLSYADETAKFVSKIDNVISTVSVPSYGGIYDTVESGKVVIDCDHRTNAFGYAGFSASNRSVNYFYYAFIAVTKSASAGEIKAAMKVASTTFSVGTPTSLVVYDGGVAKYTIVRNGFNYLVFAGDSVSPGNFLFTYLQNGANFLGIGYPQSATSPLTWTYNGRLIYLGSDLTLGTLDDKDLTDTVAAVNTFFGFSFAYNNAVGDKDFTSKSAGNPVYVSDTYNYITASTITVDDDEIDIVQTGDFSANVVIVMAASVVLAAAALAFVAKKARD